MTFNEEAHALLVSKLLGEVINEPIDHDIINAGKKFEKPSWDEYFLKIAQAVSLRSDCERSQVGAVVVKDNRIRGTGYNGAAAGYPGCETCPRRLSGCAPGSGYDAGANLCVAIHAEANALLYCDREDLSGSTLYITREPCYGCEKLINATGIERVVTPNGTYSQRP